MMKKIFVITFMAGVMGTAGLFGLACSMEKLDGSAPDVVVEEKAPERVFEDAPEEGADFATEETAAQEEAVIGEESEFEIEASSVQRLPSEELIRLSWEASSQRDLDRLNGLVDECINVYGVDAKVQQSQLMDFPERGEEANYKELNDVGTCLFIKAEAVMNSGKSEEAIRQFKSIIDQYPWAQAWDPRGWFWSVAEKSQASINVLTGKAEEDFVQTTEPVELIKPQILEKGKVNIVDYTKYGEFQNVGKEKYFYRMHDPDGLSEAIGEGIYPNTGAIYDNPRYKIIKKEGRLEGKHWDFIRTHDLEAAYFKWVMAPEPWGVRLFYLGIVFEKAGMYYEAIRAYHALVVHFPKTVAWTYWQTPWYPGQAAIAKIRHIIRSHPELNLDDKWMKIEVNNGYDNSIENDVFIVYPGKIVEKGVIDKVKDTLGIEEIRTPLFSHTFDHHHPELKFTDVRVPAGNRIGPEGEGMGFSHSWFRRERLMIAARNCGAAARLIEGATAFAKDRKVSGEKLIDKQMVQSMLADSVTELWAARLITFDAAEAHDSGDDVKSLHARCSMAKLYASEAASRVADRALQILGGRGYMRENCAERFTRELRVDRIWEGASEVQRLIIARALAKRGLDGM